MKYKMAASLLSEPIRTSEHRFPSLEGLFEGAEQMLVDSDQAISVRITAPGIDVSVSVGDAFDTRMMVNADELEDEAHEEKVRSFVARLVQVL